MSIKDDKHLYEQLDSMSDTIQNIDKELALQRAALEAHKDTFERHIKNNSDLYSEFKRMNNILQQNTDSLKEHMHRTSILEESVTKINDRFSPVEIDFIENKAIKTWKKNWFLLSLKIGVALATIGTAVIVFKPFLIKFLAMI